MMQQLYYNVATLPTPQTGANYDYIFLIMKPMIYTTFWCATQNCVTKTEMLWGSYGIYFLYFRTIYEFFNLVCK